MSLWLYDQESDAVSPRRSGLRDSDAGTAPMTGEDFMVEARSETAALDGARRWLANWADETEASVPDDLALEERQRPWCMALRVL